MSPSIHFLCAEQFVAPLLSHSHWVSQKSDLMYTIVYNLSQTGRQVDKIQGFISRLPVFNSVPILQVCATFGTLSPNSEFPLPSPVRVRTAERARPPSSERKSVFERERVNRWGSLENFEMPVGQIARVRGGEERCLLIGARRANQRQGRSGPPEYSAQSCGHIWPLSV